MMIRAYETTHSIGNLQHLTIITQIMKTAKVPFKVAPKGRKEGRVVRHGTLQKMGLIKKIVGSASLTPGPSRSRSTSVKSIMMGLLHKLVRKVSKVLKNQRTLALTQKQLAACYNADHPEHPTELGSMSESNSNAELKGEEAFNIPSP